MKVNYKLIKYIHYLLFSLPHPQKILVINLGNIRQTYIKNVAIDLAEKYPNQFKYDNFQHNKQKVDEFSDVNSKLLRNRIVGYITRYLANQKKELRRLPDFE